MSFYKNENSHKKTEEDNKKKNPHSQSIPNFDPRSPLNLIWRRSKESFEEKEEKICENEKLSAKRTATSLQAIIISPLIFVVRMLKFFFLFLHHLTRWHNEHG